MFIRSGKRKSTKLEKFILLCPLSSGALKVQGSEILNLINFLDALASLDLKLSVSQSVSESYFFRSSNSESVSH